MSAYKCHHSHHAQVQSQKFCTLGFRQQEYCEQPNHDERPESYNIKKCNNNNYYYYYYYSILLLLFQATRGVRSPNLQVVITHASYSYVCSQHSFGLPLRMYGMHRTHFDHARLDVLSRVIWSRVFWPTVTWNVRKAQRWSKSVLTFDRCNPSSLTFGY